MTWLREIDRWLAEQILPFAADYRRLATRLVGPAEADDIVQEAYARLITYDRWREVQEPRAWCLKVIRNLAIDRLRSADVVHLDRFVEFETLSMADEQPDAFRGVAARRDFERLAGLIDRLPSQCARVVRMRKIEGRSPQEIAVSLGISVSTVEKHLTKGLAIVVTALRDGHSAGEARSRRWDRRRKRS